MPRRAINFPPYILDLDAGFLRAGDRAITLRPKTWAVLCYLAARPACSLLAFVRAVLDGCDRSENDDV